MTIVLNYHCKIFQETFLFYKIDFFLLSFNVLRVKKTIQKGIKNSFNNQHFSASMMWYWLWGPHFSGKKLSRQQITVKSLKSKPYLYKIYNFVCFWDVRGPHAARGPRFWDPCIEGLPLSRWKVFFKLAIAELFMNVVVRCFVVRVLPPPPPPLRFPLCCILVHSKKTKFSFSNFLSP